MSGNKIIIRRKSSVMKSTRPLLAELRELILHARHKGAKQLENSVHTLLFSLRLRAFA